MKKRTYKSFTPLSFASIIILCILLVSCKDDFGKRDLTIPIIQGPTTPFVYELPDMLISKVYFVYFHDDTASLITEYVYDSSYRLIQKISTNNTTSSYNLSTEDYSYDDNRLIRVNKTTIVEIENSIETPQVSYSEMNYTYDNLGYLVSQKEDSRSIAQNFKYNEDGQIVMSYYGTIDLNICDECDEYYSVGYSLWTSYIYENGNAIKAIDVGCNSDHITRLFYDDKKRPSDGLDYVPQNRIFYYTLSGLFNQSFSKSNLLNSEDDHVYYYEYNEYDYPTKITSVDNWSSGYYYLIEYIKTNE